MPYLENGLLATKTRNVLPHQETLLRMNRHPEQVRSVNIDNLGRVFVQWQDGVKEPLGALHIQYWRDFRNMIVKSFSVTGGKTMEQYTRTYESGKLTPLTSFGCNLMIDYRSQ